MVAHTTSNNLSIFLYPDLVHSVMRSTFGLDDTGEARIPLNNTNTFLLSTLWYVYSCLWLENFYSSFFISFIGCDMYYTKTSMNDLSQSD